MGAGEGTITTGATSLGQYIIQFISESKASFYIVKDTVPQTFYSF